MSPTRALARPLMAAMYIADGASALKSPGPRVDTVRSAGLSEPEKLVQVNAATMLAGGLLLATGRLPRLSALALLVSMVPTTWVDHPFWSETDPQTKQTQQRHFLKNLSMMGGLLLATADTGGRESLPHAAGRLSRRAQRKGAKAASTAQKRVAS